MHLLRYNPTRYVFSVHGSHPLVCLRCSLARLKHITGVKNESYFSLSANCKANVGPSSPSPQPAPQPVLRVDRGACHHLHFVGRPSQLHVELPQQQGQSHRRLQERELVPHALARPPAEGEESEVRYDLVNRKQQTDTFLISCTGDKFVQRSKREREREKRELNLTSLGYIAPGLRSGSKPDQPSMLSSFFGTENLSGSNSFGRSQKYGDLWRLYTCSARIYRKSSNGLEWTGTFMMRPNS